MTTAGRRATWLTVGVLVVALGIGAYVGVFEIPSPTREVCVAWVWFYHVGLTGYAFGYRVRGQTIPWVGYFTRDTWQRTLESLR